MYETNMLMTPETQATIILLIILYTFIYITILFVETLRRFYENDTIKIKKQGQTGLEALGELLFVSLYRTTYIFFGVFIFWIHIIRWLVAKR